MNTQLDSKEDLRSDSSKLNTTSYQEYRLLLSVSIPVFDLRGNRNNHVKKANLLGVAGTDVPIEDIKKLTLPFKLGVNGYVFIVSNNGYVILHPDLRPVAKGILKLNYNSVDLTEVEILHDHSGPRQPGLEVLELRQKLVDHESGSMKNISVKFHYDNNRRVSLERRDYYFRPLTGTPFGIAVALPNYGTTWIKVGDEISKARSKNINILSLFTGKNWRIHPNWVYCRYHYSRGYREKAEDELLHFINLLQDKTDRDSDWYMPSQYEASRDNSGLNCSRKTLDQEAYYCNEELMQLLVFDARLTQLSFTKEFHLDDFAKKYKVFLRFVSTQSGLTRWQRVGELSKQESEYYGKAEFGDLYKRSINEQWYKGAVFQHQIDPNSVSVSVSWEAGKRAVVTIAVGIFPKDGGLEAPGAVIGFLMPMESLLERFIDITSQTLSSSFNCTADEINCYLIDQNGYIVISEAEHDPVGQFLGTLHGPVMQSMLNQEIFTAVEIYDYQALCVNIMKTGAGNLLTNPIAYILEQIFWLFIRITWYALQVINSPISLAQENGDEYNDIPKEPLSQDHEEIQTYPCDERRTLYIMDQRRAERGVSNKADDCSRPFFARRVPHTNLLLLVVNVLNPTCDIRLEPSPFEIDVSTYANMTEGRPCHKIPLNDLSRRRLENCFTEHPLENEIEACGGTSGLKFLLSLVFSMIFLVLSQTDW